MISLLQLNKLVKIISCLFIIIFNITFSYAEDDPADIWKKNGTVIGFSEVIK